MLLYLLTCRPLGLSQAVFAVDLGVEDPAFAAFHESDLGVAMLWMEVAPSRGKTYISSCMRVNDAP